MSCIDPILPRALLINLLNDYLIDGDIAALLELLYV